jgi:CheY-like chemotaxis protein
MTAILGWIQLLREPSVREKNLDRAIDAIDSNSRAQNRLIEDLLDMSRILSGKLTIKPGVVDLRQVVKSAIDAVGPAAIEKKVGIVQDISQPEDFKLAGDGARLQQVVSNLLSNAVKFTPAGGQVTVLLKRNDHTARVVVSDTGRGIRPEFLPYVFERFRQADGSTTRQHGGLGLGLAIVKHLVEIHGGSVAAHSEGEGHGATFTIELPLTAPVIVPPAPTEQNTSVARPVSLQGLKILLVEDDRGAAEVVRTILEHAGATVDSASSAAAGLERVREQNYDVLISDIGMPDMDGYGLIRRVREMENGSGRQLPAIALTAFANKDDREEALKAGYHMHLAKPVAPDDLSRAVASVVGEIRTA